MRSVLSITSLILNGLLRTAPAPFRRYYALVASTGLRAGEARALKMGPDRGNGSFLDLEKGIVSIRTHICGRRGKAEESTNWVREVDICKPIVEWLKGEFHAKVPGTYLFQTRHGAFWHCSYLYAGFERDGILGSNSLRRFREAYLENMGVPRELVDYWLGRGSKIVAKARYTKLGQSIDSRKSWCRRAGLGFQLPGLEETVEELSFKESL